jgi:phosphoglycolate phosphatase
LHFDGVIFDLDGTLADTLDDLASALNRVLRAECLPPHDLTWYKRMIGHGIRQLVSDALPPEARTDETIARCHNGMIADYGEHCLVTTHLYDGVAELVEHLVTDGVKVAVFSNKADDLTRRIVDALLGSDTFAAVVGAQHGLPLKPDPTAALLISTHLALPPRHIAYLGDTRIDMLTARRAGMLAVGVSWGFRARDELFEGGASAVLDHPLELLALRD